MNLEVSFFEQSAIPSMGIFTAMEDIVRLLAVELDGDDGFVVAFSDGTVDGYVAEELLKLRPYRERLRSSKIHHVPSEELSHDNPDVKASETRTKLRGKVSHSRH